MVSNIYSLVFILMIILGFPSVAMDNENLVTNANQNTKRVKTAYDTLVFYDGKTKANSRVVTAIQQHVPDNQWRHYLSSVIKNEKQPTDFTKKSPDWLNSYNERLANIYGDLEVRLLELEAKNRKREILNYPPPAPFDDHWRISQKPD